MLVYPISVARAKYDHRPALLLIPSLRCIWPPHRKVGPRDQRASLARRVRPSCSSPHGFACCTRSVATHTFLRRTRRQNRRLTGAAPASPAIAVWKESRRWRQDGVHSLFAKVKKKKVPRGHADCSIFVVCTRPHAPWWAQIRPADVFGFESTALGFCGLAHTPCIGKRRNRHSLAAVASQVSACQREPFK